MTRIKPRAAARADDATDPESRGNSNGNSDNTTPTPVKRDLRGIAQARTISEAMVRNMRLSLGFALIYNVLGVPVAAGLLYPLTGCLLSPMIAGSR